MIVLNYLIGLIIKGLEPKLPPEFVTVSIPRGETIIDTTVSPKDWRLIWMVAARVLFT